MSRNSLFLSLTTKKTARMASILNQNFFTNNLQRIPTKPITHTRPITRIHTSSSSSSLDKKFNARLSVNTTSPYDYSNKINNGYSGGQYEYEKGLMGNNYNQQQQQQQQEYPKPSEITWKKELCNNVQLIGNVGTPVEFKQLNSGKVLAWCSLAVRKSSTDTTWINLTFWDEMAHIASQHVEKGQQIYVSGRLVSDIVDSDDGKQQTYYKVVVQQLNFVEKSQPPPASNDGDFNYNYTSNSSSVTTGRKQKSYAANGTGSIEELWQAFFANPSEWWDNRKNKRGPKYPDFKHKDTGEALWVEGRNNPTWVKSQLSVLDSRMESYNAQNTRSDSMFGDNLTAY